jgi:hypothetical protein
LYSHLCAIITASWDTHHDGHRDNGNQINDDV